MGNNMITPNFNLDDSYSIPSTENNDLDNTMTLSELNISGDLNNTTLPDESYDFSSDSSIHLPNISNTSLGEMDINELNVSNNDSVNTTMESIGGKTKKMNKTKKTKRTKRNIKTKKSKERNKTKKTKRTKRNIKTKKVKKS